MTMRKCDTPIISGPECDGHLGKFDDCLAEALYEWSLDGTDAHTGDSDFEGHLSMILVESDTTATIDPDGVARVVAVPAGNYLLWTASTGAVTLTVADTAEEARNIFQACDTRYSLWDQGCNPNDPAGHEDCADYDECQHPEWADA